MAETQEQWYDILQETYDKWLQEMDTIKQQLEETEDEDEIRNLDKKIKNIIPTLEKYKYYLDYRANPTEAIVESQD